MSIKRRCPFCEQEINVRSSHIYKCKKRSLNLNKKEIKFEYYKFNFPKICNKKILYREYVINKHSLPELREKFGLNFRALQWLMTYFNIEQRNSSKACLLGAKKQKEYYKKNFNVENCSQLKEIKEKKRQTFLKNYGVDNIYKDENFKIWIKNNNFAWTKLSHEENKRRIEKQTKSIKNFWNNTENEKYIKEIKYNNKCKYQKFLNSLSENEKKEYNKRKISWWYKLSDEQKSTIFSRRKRSSSKLESKIAEILSFLSISFTRQKFINRKSYDFYLSNTNILIEVNGDYWHANPKIYESTDIIKYPGKKIPAQKIWNYDEKKKKLAEKKGFKIIYIWENEIIKKTDNELIKLLCQKINL